MNKKVSGVTVIEFLIVIVIVAILTTWAVMGFAAIKRNADSAFRTQQEQARIQAEQQQKLVEDREQLAKKLVAGVANNDMPVAISSNVFYFSGAGKEFTVFVMENANFGISNTGVKMNMFINTRKTMSNYCPDFPWIMGVTNGFFVEIEKTP